MNIFKFKIVTNRLTNNPAYPARSRMNVWIVHSFLPDASVTCPKPSFRPFHHFLMSKVRCGPIGKLLSKPDDLGQSDVAFILTSGVNNAAHWATKRIICKA